MGRALTSTMVSVTRITSWMPSAPSSSMLRRRLMLTSPGGAPTPPPRQERGPLPRSASSLADHVAADYPLLADFGLLIPPGRQGLSQYVRPLCASPGAP